MTLVVPPKRGEVEESRRGGKKNEKALGSRMKGFVI